MRKMDNRGRNYNYSGDKKSTGFSNDCVYELNCEEPRILLGFYWANKWQCQLENAQEGFDMEDEFVLGHMVCDWPMRHVGGDAQETDVFGIKMILGT